ncbi:hypothetical protein Hypma_011252 [Hypsizygus marmoreus]|uniref:Uncharacterized protein n=1 Tax=Hypsizygus marmoreus TaxID=39966 RepID=A0A369JQL0_HYPMA|nr:hypothetical protein Hypma_011252 [Hypsizygus marmoreus]
MYTFTSQSTLPPELLAKIFVHCFRGDEYVDEHSGNIGPAVELPRLAGSLPWTLGHICSRWRYVALHEPRLWNRIFIDYNFYAHDMDEFEKLVQPLSRMMELVVSRSARVPLTIFIRSAMEDDELYSQRSFQSLIRPYLERIAHLDLFVTSALHVVDFLRQPSGTAQALESATIMVIQNIDSALRSAGVFEGALALRRLTLYGLYPPLAVPRSSALPGDFKVPWSQLTHLTLTVGYISPVAAHDLLAKCHNLRVCHISISDSAVSHTTPRSVHVRNCSLIMVPQLQQLILDPETATAASEFFQAVLCPSLNSLIQPIGVLARLSYSVLSSFILRSHCELLELDINGCDEDVVPLLEVLCHLKKMRICELLPSRAVEHIAARRFNPALQVIDFGVESVDILAKFVDGLEDALFATPEKQPIFKEITVTVVAGFASVEDAFLVQKARCDDFMERWQGEEMKLKVNLD